MEHEYEEVTFVGVPVYKLKSKEKYLTKEQKDHLTKILQTWRQQLMQQVNETMEHLQVDAVHAADPLDRAAQEEEFSVELRARDRERKLIKKIDQTIEKIKENDYGYCESCDAEIGLRRLEARPTASSCVDCKAVNEIMEQRTTS